MRILGLDVETTGLDPNTDRIIEIGAVLWDTETSKPVRIWNATIQTERQIPAMITELTGITQDMVQSPIAVRESDALEILTWYFQQATHVMAHNAPFDKSFIDPFTMNAFIEWIWIDTRKDLPPEAYTKGKSAALNYLAADHGFVNPFAHRAVFDVLTMLKVASHYSIDDILENMRQPTIEVSARVSYDDRHKAKDAGFHWHAQRKSWVKEIKKNILEATTFDFPVSTREL